MLTNDIDILRQEIDILFDSTPGDLLGDLDYGTDYQRFLYDLHMSPAQLEQAMMQDLMSLDLRGYTPQVQAYFLQGTQRDIAVIQVDLYKDGIPRYSKTLKIE